VMRNSPTARETRCDTACTFVFAPDEEVRFAADSAVEEAGFELAVPHAIATVSTSPERDPTAYTETNYTRFQEKGPASPQGSSFRYRRGGPPISGIGAPWLTTATLRVGSKNLVDTGYTRVNSGTAKSRRLASESSSAVIGRGHLRIVGALLDLRGQASLG
jgi:hypothetical protein